MLIVQPPKVPRLDPAVRTAIWSKFQFVAGLCCALTSGFMHNFATLVGNIIQPDLIEAIDTTRQLLVRQRLHALK